MIAIIPARGGSQRILGKNIKRFFGKPILAYSIETARESKLFERIVVSTDTEEIFRVSERHGAEGYMRQASYGQDDVGTQLVAKECLQGLQYEGGFACVIYATAPLMSVEDLKRGYKECRDNAHGNHHGGFAFSVGYPPLCDAAQFYFGPIDLFLQQYPLVSPDTVMVPIDSERVCDIDTMGDWERAELMYKELYPRSNG